MKKTFLSTMAFALCVGAVITSCSKDEVEPAGMQGNNGTSEIVPDNFSNAASQATGIPTDEQAGQSMPGQIGGLTDNDGNTTISNPSYSFTDENGYTVLNFDMTGIQNASSAWLDLRGTGFGDNQNLWVTIDGTPKGVDVYNTSEGQGSRKMLVDVVFLVDNSGSMGDEANAVANEIDSWAKSIEDNGLDAKFGCVGYGYYVGSQYTSPTDNYGIAGAMNISNRSVLTAFLNRTGFSGVRRTFGYYGDDAERLETIASTEKYNVSGGECVVQALNFADETFSFRQGANRVYVNFSDDCNYPASTPYISTDYVKKNWSVTKGTIHTVMSNDTTALKSYFSEGYAECPWDLSRYTGGTIKTARYDFSDVTLADLPITGALQHSYKLRVTNVEALKDGKPHEVKIVVYADNGAVIAVKTLYVIFS